MVLICILLYSIVIFFQYRMCRLVKWNSSFVLKLKNLVFGVMLLDLVWKSQQADRWEFVASFAAICKKSTIFYVAHKFYDLATKTWFWTWMYLMTWALIWCNSKCKIFQALRASLSGLLVFCIAVVAEAPLMFCLWSVMNVSEFWDLMHDDRKKLHSWQFTDNP
jgi:hypothetical protein